MKENRKSDKDLLQLGLPPMTLAECNEKNRAKRDLLFYNIAKNTCLLILLVIVLASVFLFFSRLVENLDQFRTTEIILVTSLKKSSNVTFNATQDIPEITLNIKNNTPSKRRIKRLVSENLDDTEETIAKFRDKHFEKAREVILNHNLLCNTQNKNEVCKDLVTKLQAITDGEHDSDIKNNKAKEAVPQMLPKDKSKDPPYKVSVSPTELSKREVYGMADLESYPFNRDAYGYPSAPYQSPLLPPYPLPQSHQDPLHPPTDTCLLARLLKNQHPHSEGIYERPRPNLMPSQSYGYAQPVPHNIYDSPFLQDRDADSGLNQPHPQDIEILKRFLTTTTTPAVSITEKAANTSTRESQCPEGTISCDNGEKCLPESKWCNGHVDCQDVSDEARCSCKSRVDKFRLCDGYFDCPFGEDEMGCYGCSENAFSCEDLDVNSKSTCFLKEQRCNNIMDCPNSRDEIDCNMLSPNLHSKPLFAISNTEGFLQRNFKGDWYAVCRNPYMWAHDACRRETGLIIRPPYIQVVPIDPQLQMNYLNTASGGIVHTSDTCFNSSAIYVTCPDLLCGTRILTTSQLLKENAAIENHLFGRNKRFLASGRSYYSTFIAKKPKTVSKSMEAGQNIVREEQTTKYNDEMRKKRAESRVVGGRPSKPAAWPWMVALYRDGMFHCGGIIVTQHWILSAAHCAKEFWKHYFEAQVGMLRRFSFSPQEQNHRISHVIVNQQYSQEDMKNDVSLFKVKSTMQFSRWVRPICLPGPNTAGQDWLWGPPPGTMCTTVGWGATVEHGPDPDHMREVEVPIWANCKHQEDRQGKEICAGLMEGGKDACQGDSGGPLLCRNPLNSQQWYLAGIVSHGDGCARKGEPGVYTRVSLFVKWIRSNIASKLLPSIQPLQKCPGFRCSSGILKCLPDTRVCDKIIDCLNGEDEMNCNSRQSSKNIFFRENEISPESRFREALFTAIDRVPSALASTVKPNINRGQSTDDLNHQLIDSLQHTSTLKLPLTTSSEDLRDNSEQVTVDPTSTFERESSPDEQKFFTISSTKTAFESRSSVTEHEEVIDNTQKKETKAADIQENWFDFESTTTVTDVKGLTDSKDQTTEEIAKLSTQEPTTTTLTLKTSLDSKLKELQNEINNRGDKINITNEQESKSFLVELIPMTQNTNLDSEGGNSFNRTTKLENKELPSKDLIEENGLSKTINNFNDRLEIIHKIEDIVLSELQPAKIRKKHLTPKEFECRRILQTIPYRQRCDHKADCEDGTDELGCTCVDYLFAFEKTLLCDGIFDCADGQDEIDCFSCPEDRFLCKKSQICLPMKNVCDGKSHCPQGEDELDCYALSNGKEIQYEFDERPKIMLEGYVTKKMNNEWHIVCEDDLSTEQQEHNAAHICHYLGFSSANRYLLKHINIRDEILKSKFAENRKRRDIRSAAPVHFTYRDTSENGEARHILIKDPQVLKETCVPNVKKTCLSLYVNCDPGLFTNFDISQNMLYSRSAETNVVPMWPWIAKVFVEGEYKCTGVLVDKSLVLVSHSCLWDSLLTQHHIYVVLGSHRTLNFTKGPFEQILKVDGTKEIYRSNIVLLHINSSIDYSSMARPMVVQSSSISDERAMVCVAVGQDENNKTVSVFVEETRVDCPTHNKCFNVKSKSKLCPTGMISSRQWAGIISCHTERGWYPAASFVDSRGECGLNSHIIGTSIENLKFEIKQIDKNDVFVHQSPNITDKCNGVRCGRGHCVHMRQICNGVRNCEDGSDESEESCERKHQFCGSDPHNRECECSSGQFRCHNGRCISKELFNNGQDDCGDRTDEPEESSCSKYLARVKPSRLCDGVLHCHDKSDEDPMFCKCFAKKTYPCGKTSDDDHCVAPDMVCDGVPDCPNGYDEKTCIGLHAPVGTPHGRGQVIIQTHGVWHTKCYPSENHTRSDLEAICRELGFISGHAKQLDVTENLVYHPYNSVLLDPFSEVNLNNKTNIKLRNTNEPLARAIFDDKLNNCYPVFIECL